tara:strand:+ start:508 stop:711 length:204 start_codon:yes stop_codon:yes gene_type:complete
MKKERPTTLREAIKAVQYANYEVTITYIANWHLPNDKQEAINYIKEVAFEGIFLEDKDIKLKESEEE